MVKTTEFYKRMRDSQGLRRAKEIIETHIKKAAAPRVNDILSEIDDEIQAIKWELQAGDIKLKVKICDVPNEAPKLSQENK